MKIPSIILTTLLGAGSLLAQDTIPAAPAAVKNWQDARFGMFIHWGPVSLKGTEIGWSRGNQVPIEEYDNLYKQFNPTEFNADEWVAVAKAAGMKYMVLTTKHHDGFCLWDTKQTDYNIMNTPFKRDVVKELAAACKKGGIAFGTYYSACDWHHPAFPLGSPSGRTKKPNPDLKAYDAYLQAQVTELVKNYGPLFTMWFDVPQSYDDTYGIPMVNMLRKLQPDLMINNRPYSVGGKGSGIGHQIAIGDYDTPEQTIGGFNMERPWETCMTICQQWAWKPNDRMKSLEECIHTLIRTNGGNGNLLFNVGPQPDGLIEPRQVERLKEMGAWLAKNSKAIYGTRGGPWKPSSRMASTRKDDKVYLHLLKKVEGPVTVSALPVAVKSAKLLNGPAIETTTADGILSFDIPSASWDDINTIVELTIDGDSMDIAPLKPSALSNIPGAKASASVIYQNDPQYSADMVLDGDVETRWATPEGTQQSWLQIDLAQATTINGIHIEEAYADHSSRVKKFELQKLDGSTWTTFHSGNALGAHFKASFDPVITNAIRLNILDASDGPTISEIHLKKP
jgi:alpha-L-fucosidase